MILCDGAQAVGGKLYIMGGGWSQLLMPDFPTNMALAVKLGIPWHEANDPHTVVARLVDADGGAVTIPNPAPAGDDGIPIRNEVIVETGRPPGLAPGTDLDAPLVFNFNGLALPAGSYVWELEVDGTVEARTPFRVGAVRRR
jgi:Family of unknown function (DUF6941)